jgi:hypothetical protein
MELNMRGDYGEVEVQIRDQMSVESIDMGIVSRPPPSSASPYVQTMSHLNWLSSLPSYEGRAAVEGVTFKEFIWVLYIYNIQSISMGL